MNKIVKSLWIGNQLSNNEILCIKSFLYHKHEFHLYAYNEIKNLPNGVKLMDANTILSESLLFKDSAGTYASFADWFRLKLLYELGGWWVDMDLICLQPFNIEQEYCISSEREFETNQKSINNTCMKFPEKSSHLEQIIKIVDDKIKANNEIQWGEIGVYLFRSCFTEGTELYGYVNDAEVFCPVNYFSISELICKCDFSPSYRSLSIHLWNEIWRRGCLDKNAIYHPESIYEQLKLKYFSISY